VPAAANEANTASSNHSMVFDGDLAIYMPTSIYRDSIYKLARRRSRCSTSSTSYTASLSLSLYIYISASARGASLYACIAWLWLRGRGPEVVEDWPRCVRAWAVVVVVRALPEAGVHRERQCCIGVDDD
jgi:hypothetical protein